MIRSRIVAFLLILSTSLGKRLQEEEIKGFGQSGIATDKVYPLSAVTLFELLHSSCLFMYRLPVVEHSTVTIVLGRI